MGHTQRRRAAAVVAAGLLALTACGGGDDPTPVAEAGQPPLAAGAAALPAPGRVAAATAADLAADPGITVLDLRTPEEFAEGHLEGATMIDFYSSTFADEIAALDRDGEYLIYCRSGNRSGQAFSLMAQLGFEQVYDLDGGVLAWGAAGLPLSGS
jgi:rhodanese-related sulfurtransferase